VNPQHFASFDGTRIAWREIGSGRPIVLLHGLFSSAEMNWHRYGAAAEIAAAGFRVITPDHRGHGDSDAPHAAAAYPADVLAMDVEALVAHLGVADFEGGGFDLGGYSLGARTAVRLLARGMAPARCVLGGMGLSGIVGSTERANFFLKVLAQPDGWAPGSAEHFTAAFMKQNRIDTVAVAHVLRAQLQTPIETVRGLATPTLVVCGAEDHDNGSAADLAMALPSAAHVAIPGNHMSAVTKPDFGTAIAAWLQHR
jgi:pimeloyl-ACP methyl ester carboxylesterase